MQSTLLVDSGPLVAWLNERDKHHALADAFFLTRTERLVTTWAVCTEVCHLSPRQSRTRFLRWIALGGATVWHIPDEQAAVLADLMDRYADLPMDMADASLVWLAGQVESYDIATLDRKDFAVYRGSRNRPFRNVFFD